MDNIVKAYYDANGALCKCVIVVNEPNYDHTAHDNLPGEETWIGVVIDKAVHDAFPDPLNVNGIAVHHDMNKAVAAQIAQKHPSLSAKLLANATSLDNQIAIDAKNAADLQAVSLDTWNKFPSAYQQLLLSSAGTGIKQPSLSTWLAAETVLLP